MNIKKSLRIKKGSVLKFTHASHEDEKNPSAVKKVLLSFNDLTKRSKIVMINWAVLYKDRSFTAHYHEDMDEVFIIISGEAEIVVNKEKANLTKGDLVFIPMKCIHQMTCEGNKDLEYIAIGFSLFKGGKTVNV